MDGAQFLAAQGRVDGKRCVISGGSAGGYTTLAALTFQSDD
jgi:dipeptidyl aminopeptidase/acylaminoacyl peptidase